MSVEAKDFHELQRGPGPQQGPGNFRDWKIGGWEKLGEALGAEQRCLQLSPTTLLGTERENSMSVAAYTTRTCVSLSIQTWHQAVFSAYGKNVRRCFVSGVGGFAEFTHLVYQHRIKVTCAMQNSWIFFSVRPHTMAFIVCVSTTTTNLVRRNSLADLQELGKNYLVWIVS